MGGCVGGGVRVTCFYFKLAFTFSIFSTYSMSGLEMIKLVSMLNSAENELYPAHKC